MSAGLRDLLRIGLALAAVFASTFLVLRLGGWLTLDDIRAWLAQAHEAAPLYVAGVVAALLFADLFVAMPTLTLTILAGYFLGAPLGAAAASVGMMAAGLCGYALGRRHGTAILSRIYRDPERLTGIQAVFAEHGLFVLLVCRALPILPEVSCCLAGATRMPFRRFIAGFSVGTLPYAAIAAFSGSRSSVEDPLPAILAFIALPGSLWLAWHVFRVRSRRASPAE
ncbi:MAG TPA: VTT domain-containing protein [Pseudoxanthomonas sp.]|nr:VTT domain-containing protein [Pseudoxanthomonas sp.]